MKQRLVIGGPSGVWASINVDRTICIREEIDSATGKRCPVVEMDGGKCLWCYNNTMQTLLDGLQRINP